MSNHLNKAFMLAGGIALATFLPGMALAGDNDHGSHNRGHQSQNYGHDDQRYQKKALQA